MRLTRSAAAVAAAAFAAEGACPGQNMLANPADPSAFGPWPVSSRIVVTRDAVKYPDDDGNGTITRRAIHGLEVWFPATPGSEKGATPYTYSYNTQQNPVSEARKIPACASPPSGPQCCEYPYTLDHVWEGLPLDTAHGPYPVIMFLHGHGGWRGNVLHLVEHWASRGFVVVTADYPGVCGHDLKKQTADGTAPPKADEPGDTQLLLDELRELSHPNLAFLKGHIDVDMLGITGHSQGGLGTGTLSKTTGKVLIAMAGGGTHARAGGAYQTLILGGSLDAFARPAMEDAGYAGSPRPKRQLVVAGSGHQTYGDICWMSPAQGGIEGIGLACPVPPAGGAQFASVAAQGCRFANTSEAKDMIPPEAAWEIARYATAGVFEETLLCDTRMTEQLAALPSRFNQTQLDKWREDLAPTPPTPPAPVPPAPPAPVPAACIAELARDCGSTQGDAPACAGCVVRHVADLRAAGCNIALGTRDDSYAWCHHRGS